MCRNVPISVAVSRKTVIELTSGIRCMFPLDHQSPHPEN